MKSCKVRTHIYESGEKGGRGQRLSYFRFHSCASAWYPDVQSVIYPFTPYLFQKLMTRGKFHNHLINEILLFSYCQ